MSDQLTTDQGARKRSPRYHVFEMRTLDPITLDDRIAHPLKAWVQIGENVSGATDRKAIEAVIGTNENPVEGFDADRRLLPHVAVLTRHWTPRTRKRVVSQPTPVERAKLEALLAGTVTEEWE